jgi:hypothetical protein
MKNSELIEDLYRDFPAERLARAVLITIGKKVGQDVSRLMLSKPTTIPAELELSLDRCLWHFTSQQLEALREIAAGLRGGVEH